MSHEKVKGFKWLEHDSDCEMIIGELGHRVWELERSNRRLEKRLRAVIHATASVEARSVDYQRELERGSL